MMMTMMRQWRIDNDNNDNDGENAGRAVSTYLDTQTIQAPPAGRSQSWGLGSEKFKIHIFKLNNIVLFFKYSVLVIIRKFDNAG